MEKDLDENPCTVCSRGKEECNECINQSYYGGKKQDFDKLERKLIANNN